SAAEADRKWVPFQCWSDFCRTRQNGSTGGGRGCRIILGVPRLFGACWNRISPALAVAMAILRRTRHPSLQPKQSKDWLTNPGHHQNTHAPSAALFTDRKNFAKFAVISQKASGSGTLHYERRRSAFAERELNDANRSISFRNEATGCISEGTSPRHCNFAQV